MNKQTALIVAMSIAVIGAAFFPKKAALAQKDQKPQAPTVNLKRTVTRHETYRLPYGGSVTVLGAPIGSILIEGWNRNEIDIVADIELQAPTEGDLSLLAAVNNFGVDVDSDHVRIITAGTHDKKYMQQVAKKFPKALLGLPWKIDFRLKVPVLTDVEIDAGVGPIKLHGVEGNTRLNALQSDADLTLIGGYFAAIIQRGAVKLTIPTRSWRGLGGSLQLAGGTLEVALAPGFSADIDGTVLRLGEIRNAYPGLAPREGTANPRMLRGRAGSGGARLSFTVGDGILEFKSLSAAP